MEVIEKINHLLEKEFNEKEINKIWKYINKLIEVKKE